MVEAPRRDHVPLAIAYMIGATMMFAASSAVSKWLVEKYPVGESAVHRAPRLPSAVCALLIVPRTGLSVFRTHRLHHHMLRGTSQVLSQTFLLIAFSMMPLAGAIAINFSSPLFTTLVSALVFKEAVGAARWAALLVGFCGVLIVANPGADALRIGALFALGNAVLYGSVTAAVRSMTTTESVRDPDALSVAPPHRRVRPAPPVWLGLAHPLGHRPGSLNGTSNAHRTVLVDTGAASRSGLGSRAVLLRLADLGESFWVCIVWARIPDHRSDRSVLPSWSPPGCSCYGVKAMLGRRLPKAAR